VIRGRAVSGDKEPAVSGDKEPAVSGDKEPAVLGRGGTIFSSGTGILKDLTSKIIVMDDVDVVIETPKGSAQKYNYDPDSHFFRLKKILPSGMVFPYDFGFIPHTKGEDGDPLDVIVISEFCSFPGIVIKCRIIGGIKAEQSAKKGSDKLIRNDRFLAVPKCSSIFEDIRNMEDLPKKIMDQLEQFFVEYNKLEGKQFKALKQMDAKEAGKLIEVDD
jgi:inorganic pyrophosphatase